MGGKEGRRESRVAVEDPDSLRSRAYANVLDLLCEGEIGGLVNGLRSVYFDGTPLVNEDGTLNFAGVTVVERNGTQGQSPIPGFTATESEQSVNAEVVAATPVIRSVTNPDIDAVRVRLAIPGLSRQNTSTGDLTGATVQVAIDVQSNGGGYVAQPIGHSYVASPNPAVTAADGLQIEVFWRPGVNVSIGDSIAYQVDYRQVGTGSWTTYRTDRLAATELRAVRFPGNDYSEGYVSRIYTIIALPTVLYEVRALKTAGFGPISVGRFFIGTPIEVDTITGKTTSTYQRSYRIALSGSPPWDIRVRRVTPDSTSVALRNRTYWDGYTELIETKFSYPNSALVAVSVDSSNFSSIPVRGYDVKLLLVKIPSNYDPVTRVYTGIWDGTFTVAWTDNPAWCFYDLLTNERYGLGRFLPAAQVDKWGLYQIGQYCDEFVPNAVGFYEPRFTCNIYIQTRQEAFRVVTQLASVFRGMVYWAGGVVTAVQDAPADPVSLFTEANVVDGLFSYVGSSRQARHTVALVSWNDPDDGYKLKPEYVEDTAAIARYGIAQTELVAVGCTSRGQAHRLGEWLLYSERYETEVITFRCGHDGTYLRPGDIFAVQDQHRAGVRFGGRTVSATTSSLTIDQAVTIQSGHTYTLQVVLPDGTLDTKTLTNAPGSTAVLTISGTFTVTPVSPAVWILTSSAVSPRLYRALSITEVERHLYEVNGVAHNPSKYDYIERDYLLETPQTSTLSLVPAAPQNVAISESLAISGGTIIVVVEISWEAVQGATRYIVEYRRDSGNYTQLPHVVTNSAEIRNALPGFYEVRVSASNVLSYPSAPSTASAQIYGKTARPADVTGFVVARTEDRLVFSWSPVPDLDLDYYEVRQGTSWETGVSLGITIATQWTVVTNIGATYLVKAFDTSGNESLNPAVIVASSNTDINIVVTQNDATGWTGVHVDTVSDVTGVTLDTGEMTGTYETNPVDLGAVMTSRVEIEPVVTQENISDTWADFTLPWSSYTDPWTGVPGIVSASYEMALSQDGSTWSAWQNYQSGHYSARAYKFRVTLTTLDLNYLPRLTTFPITIDVPDRVLHFEDMATSSGGTAITFTPAFVNVQTVGVTIQSGAVGDTFTVTSKSNSGVTITVYDSGGSPKAGVVDIDVFGYGAV